MLDEIEVPAEPYDPDDTYSPGPMAPLQQPMQQGPALLFGPFLPGQHVARLIAHDIASGTSRVVGEWQRGPTYDRLALVVRDDGTFALVAGDASTVTVWTGNADGPVNWLGETQLPGRLVLQPGFMERGVVVAFNSRMARVCGSWSWGQGAGRRSLFLQAGGARRAFGRHPKLTNR